MQPLGRITDNITAMKTLFGFVIVLLRMAVISAVISAVFSGIQWLLSLINVCDTQTWSKFICGGAIIFAVWFVISPTQI